MNKTVSIVVPVFNEELSIATLVERISSVMLATDLSYELILVNDGSTDTTGAIINEMISTNPNLFTIAFSRNFGHQSALKAGIDYAQGDCVITMDADLQHPPDLLPLLISQWQDGFEVVHTKRLYDSESSFFKRNTSKYFYKTINRLSELQLEDGSADFRLLDRKVVNVLKQLPERDPFFRGLVHWVGFKETYVVYHPASRFAGKSHYTTKKMFRLALQGITSFSTKPLYAAVYIGFFFAIASLLYVPYALVSYITGHIIQGWASIIVTIAFFGGVQLLIMGIIGIYLGKLFMQSKQRPVYIIQYTNIEVEHGHLAQF